MESSSEARLVANLDWIEPLEIRYSPARVALNLLTSILFTGSPAVIIWALEAPPWLTLSTCICALVSIGLGFAPIARRAFRNANLLVIGPLGMSSPANRDANIAWIQCESCALEAGGASQRLRLYTSGQTSIDFDLTLASSRDAQRALAACVNAIASARSLHFQDVMETPLLREFPTLSTPAQFFMNLFGVSYQGGAATALMLFALTAFQR